MKLNHFRIFQTTLTFTLQSAASLAGPIRRQPANVLPDAPKGCSGDELSSSSRIGQQPYGSGGRA